MLFSSQATPAAAARLPLPAVIPELAGAQIAARYQQARMGGDFFDFARAGERVVLLLLDVAGRRHSAMAVAALVQDAFRIRAPELLRGPQTNQSEALTELALELNRTVLDSTDQVRCTPAFLACYDPQLGTLWYVNGGHVAPLVRDRSGITPLESTGLPLGLFSHLTQDASICVLEPGDSLLAVSRGLLEARGPRREEFGMERVGQYFVGADLQDANQLCTALLDTVTSFVGQNSHRNLFRRLRSSGNGFSLPENDRTVLALLRKPAS